ncbi:MAG: glycosyltransferase family 2 protein [Actinobacteria bacterium]|nr:glycosyltransferase family 2 protein [Actinomycetota bacterium]
MVEPLTILVPARDEERVIGETVATLRQTFPDAEVIVADDGSRDRTADIAEAAGAIVLRLPRRGKGQALSAAERAAPPGSLLLCDADLAGELAPLLEGGADLNVAAFAEREGGGFGLTKRIARSLIDVLADFDAREPLSGQRALSAAARNACFPMAAGFGCEVRMTIDAARARLSVREVQLPLRHRPTGRNLRGFVHRGKQLRDTLYACGPLGVNFRGLRLPLVGWKVGVTNGPAVAAVAALGATDDLWSGPERGFRAHLGAGRTTGILKLIGIPAVGLLATRKISGALLVGLAANALNQLDTRPGRALKAYLAAAVPLDAPVGVAVLLLPYDLREMAMLGDAGSNALGALLGLNSVKRFTGRGQWVAIGALAGLTIIGEQTSIGAWIERTPGLAWIDRLGRV